MALAFRPISSEYSFLRPTIRRLIASAHYKEALTQLLAMPTNDVEWLDDAATCYMQLGDAQTAIQLTELICQKVPGDPLVWSKLGEMHLTLGKKDAARKAYEKALTLKQKSVPLLAALNRLAPFDRSSARTRLLRRQALSSKVSSAERASAWNALGRIEEAAGRYSDAFRYFMRSKSLSGKRHDRARFDQHLTSQHTHFDGSRAPLEMAGDRSRMIFVCGMPRTGTTLVESLYFRHSQVGTVGESPALWRSFESMQRSLPESVASDPWAFYKHASDAQLLDAREEYMTQTAMRFPQDMPSVIVDKLPFNCLLLGFARLILPDATFVYMSRHPLDLSLSNISTPFAQTNPYSHDLEDMAHMIQVVEASVAHYEAVSGAGFRRQSYRRLVKAPQEEAPALLAHAGLDWEPACLDPDAIDKPIRTASVGQVRAAINTDGLERWRPYEAEFAPLIKALGGAKAIRTWEDRDRAG